MRTRTARRGAAALLLAAAGLSLAACGSSVDTSSAASASTASSAASSSTGSSSSSTSASDDGGSDATSGSSSGAGGSGTATAPPDGTTQDGKSTAAGSGSGSSGGRSTEPACATSNLRTTAEGVDSGAGSTMFELVFQNTGSAPCTLRGFPGVSFVKIHNIQLGKAATRTSGATSVVTLVPNGHAYADVRTVNGQGGYSAAQCGLTTVPTLRVYPPNQTESTNIPWNTEECVGSSVQNLQVGPVHSDR
ncbi:DUF4232 domain-containing protein [Actinacidiphila yeochonensis]|uniref:DUF4232 domain-containing protein n=1 Tax=Actinacidiphila yeochonensis TaxID=89050 RepID=UPI00068D79DD|nr:DUF4232 domain-containing protein [Actinacidiphila yeochonensis]